MEEEQPQEKPAPRLGPPWLLFAWLTPVLSPLVFALAVWVGMVRFLEGLLKSAPGLGTSADLAGLFAMGWVCGTALCGGYAAWRMARTISEETIGRVAVFCLLWPICAGGQAAAGAAIGMPACAAVGALGH